MSDSPDDSPPTGRMPAIPGEVEAKTVPGVDEKALPSLAKVRRASSEMPLIAAEIVVERKPGMPVITAPKVGEAASPAAEVVPPPLAAPQHQTPAQPSAPRASAPRTSAPRPPAPVAKLESPSGASMYEQLMALEAAEEAAKLGPASAPEPVAPRLVYVAPGEQARVAVTGPDAGRELPPLPSAVPALAAPEPEAPTPRAEWGSLELDRGGWTPGSQAPAPSSPKVKPVTRPDASAVPRGYQQLTFKVPEPPTRSRTVLYAIVLAALGIAAASALLSRDEAEQPEAEPAVPVPARAIAAPVVAPRPALATIKLTGLPKKTNITLDGAAYAGPNLENLEPGKRLLRIESPGLTTLEQELELAPGETKELTVALPKEKKKKKK